jgi:AcrR family transcriptional regulator
MALTNESAEPSPGLDRRTALLAAAIEEIARRGTRGLRVEEVAKRARVSPALIYHHFGDRATLLQSALEHIGNQADVYTARSGASARDNLVAMLLAELQDDPVVKANSAAWGELRDSAIFDEALRPTLTQLTQQWCDDIAALIQAGHHDGSIPSTADPRALGVQLSALVEGISSRWLTGQLTTRQARRHLNAMIEGVLR